MILRSCLLFLARQKALRRWMETSSLVRPLTARFIAGPTLDDALAVGSRLERDGIMMTLDRLGENVSSLPEAEASCEGYIEALRRLDQLGSNATVSIKLTQFGLDLSADACRANVWRLAEEAARLGRTIEIDMESSEYVDRTLRLVFDLHERFGNVRVAIQAYLRRSGRDVERMCDAGIPVRLCKGAYLEPAAAAFQAKSEVDRNYVHLMKVLLERGAYPALATHDEKIIAEAKRFARDKQIAPDAFEFQMLYGIRRDLERQFAAEGYRLRLYVPYGQAWYPYFMRRLAERPANLLFLLRHLARG
ncbi:MAG TPA: proline dehydrogenase family protein [Bryobacteraceae bacterium]|nr:proline dehydrogenase family protein [Bryobacteraceae bacterium]HOL73224.1 proline dehydrogenase family protein [Bryobacteraceae bacterium]HOQ47016.1 proline dehydrogenase family protein [Bryobacteraceae bacterium]HPQ16834.1 proline dehydrogenase family protein [Bryobacteraceae bacterium]HPU73057.1 proline dehydrogenase family protein [Bryobacteraceae bacterium]